MIEQFQIGYMVVALPASFVILYLLIRQLRRLGAWVNRGEAPKERVGAYVTILAVFGFMVGGLSQSIVDTGIACYDEDQSVVTCIFKNS